MREILGAFAFSLVWPAAAAVSLGLAVGKTEVTAYGLVMLAAGTMAAYGLDRLIDSRTDPRYVKWALLISICVCAIVVGVLAFTAIWRLEVCAVLAVLAGGYVPLKRVIPKNYIVVPGWTIAVGSLPFAIAPEFDGHHTAALIAVALIMLANTMLCDVGSVEDDRQARVRAMSVWLGAAWTAIVAGIVALIGVASAVSHSHFGLAMTAISLACVAIALWKRPHSLYAHYAADLALVVFPGPVALVMG